MNLEINMMSIINAFIFTISAVWNGEILLKEKIKYEELQNIFGIVIYALFLALNAFISDKFLKTISGCVVIIIFYKIIFKKDWNKSIILGLITYIMILISEFVIGSLLSILSTIIGINIMNIIASTIIANLIIIIPMLLISYFCNKPLRKLLNYMEYKGEKILITLFAVLIIIFSVLLSRYDIRSWLFDFEFYINIVIFIVVFIIFLIIVKQHSDHNKFVNNYKKLLDYSNLTDQVLEEYRMKVHETKNQLAIIKSLIDSENEELKEYMNNLIEKNKKIKYSWVNQVKHISLPGLKGLINYKIAEFNSIGIDTSINVSKEIQKFNFDNFDTKEKDDLYTIVGVYLDNAKEAALQSETSKIDIDISKDNNSIKIIISNTYKGKIDEDKLDNYRYSTKGKERGIGLYLVKKIIDKNNRFESKRKITNSYYIQILHVKIDDLNVNK